MKTAILKRYRTVLRTVTGTNEPFRYRDRYRYQIVNLIMFCVYIAVFTVYGTCASTV
jgi:hypothetical protein